VVIVIKAFFAGRARREISGFIYQPPQIKSARPATRAAIAFNFKGFLYWESRTAAT
jgi:hypothetical protein